MGLATVWTVIFVRDLFFFFFFAYCMVIFAGTIGQNSGLRNFHGLMFTVSESGTHGLASGAAKS